MAVMQQVNALPKALTPRGHCSACQHHQPACSSHSIPPPYCSPGVGLTGGTTAGDNGRGAFGDRGSTAVGGKYAGAAPGQIEGRTWQWNACRVMPFCVGLGQEESQAHQQTSHQQPCPQAAGSPSSSTALLPFFYSRSGGGGRGGGGAFLGGGGRGDGGLWRTQGHQQERDFTHGVPRDKVQGCSHSLL